MAFDPNKKLVQDVATPPKPLPRSAFIDPNTGAERPLNNAVTNPVNYQKDLATGQANAVINRQIDAITKDPTLTPELKSQKMAVLQKQKASTIGIDPVMRTQIVAEQNLPENQYIPIRDIAKETKNANKFGLNPNDPQDTLSGLKTTYSTPQLNQMVVNGEVDTSAFKKGDLVDLGLTKERIQTLVNQAKTPEEKTRLEGLYNKLIQTGQEGAIQESVLGATPKPTNQMMGALAEALNAKSNYKNQNLGASDLFKMAGLSGYSVLAQSLNQRMQEMKGKAESAQSAISAAGGSMATAYKAISDQYNKTLENYEKQTKMLLEIDKDAKDHEQALEIMKDQDALNRKTFEFEQKIKSQTDKWTQGTREDGSTYLYDKNTGDIKDIDGSGEVAPSTTPSSSGWTASLSAVKNIFSQSGKSDYPAGKGGTNDYRECAEATNDITIGPRAGDSYASKMAGVTKRDKPQVGNNLVLPLAGKDGKVKYGHIEVVSAVDEANDTVQTQSWNRDLKGTHTVQTYKLSELKAKYKDNWGFTDSKLKPEYAKKLAAVDNKNPGENIMRSVKTGASALGGLGAVAGAVAGVASELTKGGTPTSFADRYYAATGNRDVFNKKSDLAKDLAKMTDNQKETELKNVSMSKADKAGKSADMVYLKQRGQYLIDSNDDKKGKVTREDVYFSLADEYGKEVANNIADSLTYKK